MNFFIVWTVVRVRLVTTWSVWSVLTTTVTQQSMMVDWLNVGTDSEHWTVKVNVNVTVDNHSVLTLNSLQHHSLSDGDFQRHDIVIFLIFNIVMTLLSLMKFISTE